jgi:hypothetical protein
LTAAVAVPLVAVTIAALYYWTSGTPTPDEKDDEGRRIPDHGLEAMSMEGLAAQRRWDAKDAPPKSDPVTEAELAAAVQRLKDAPPEDPATPEHPGRGADTSSTVDINTVENPNTSPMVLSRKGLGAAGAKALPEKQVAQQFGSPEPRLRCARHVANRRRQSPTTNETSPLRYEHEPSAADEAYVAQLIESASYVAQGVTEDVLAAYRALPPEGQEDGDEDDEEKDGVGDDVGDEEDSKSNAPDKWFGYGNLLRNVAADKQARSEAGAPAAQTSLGGLGGTLNGPLDHQWYDDKFLVAARLADGADRRAFHEAARHKWFSHANLVAARAGDIEDRRAFLAAQDEIQANEDKELEAKRVKTREEVEARRQRLQSKPSPRYTAPPRSPSDATAAAVEPSPRYTAPPRTPSAGAGKMASKTLLLLLSLCTVVSPTDATDDRSVLLSRPPPTPNGGVGGCGWGSLQEGLGLTEVVWRAEGPPTRAAAADKQRTDREANAQGLHNGRCDDAALRRTRAWPCPSFEGHRLPPMSP